MNKQILILMVFILTVGMTTNVFGAATFTPDCTWNYPSSANFPLEDGNTTIVAGAYSTYNMINATFTISPYRNSTTSQVITSPDGTTDNKTWSAIWAELDDGTYTIGTTFYVTNNTASEEGSPENGYSNATSMSVACSNRQFTVSTKEGQYVPPTEEKITLTGKPEKTNTKTILIIGAIVVLIGLYYNSKKK